MKRTIERITNAVSILSALFLIWICISWVDVVTDNTRPEPKHSDLNFFNVLVTVWEDGEQ